MEAPSARRAPRGARSADSARRSATPSSPATSRPAGTSGCGCPPEPGRTSAEVLPRRLGARYFCFLSAIDWMPSPFGRSMDSEVDNQLAAAEPPPAGTPPAGGFEHGITGGRDPFPGLRPGHARRHARRLLGHHRQGRRARGQPPHRHLDAGPSPGPTGTSVRPGRCSASSSTAIPACATSTCPRASRAIPLRKDFPLVRGMVKPWPGIVDVEPMPGAGDDGDAGGES